MVVGLPVFVNDRGSVDVRDCDCCTCGFPQAGKKQHLIACLEVSNSIEHWHDAASSGIHL